MITSGEIQRIASKHGLRDTQIEKDYDTKVGLRIERKHYESGDSLLVPKAPFGM